MELSVKKDGFIIRHTTEEDVPLILWFIRELAEYEKLLHEVVATEEQLKQSLFGEKKYAEVIIGYYVDKPVGFAIFFHNFSSFVGKPGLYLEDLYVIPEARGKGFGKLLLTYLADLAVRRGCGRFEWAVLDWNEPSLKFYQALGARLMNEWIINRVSGEDLTRLAALFDGDRQ